MGRIDDQVKILKYPNFILPCTLIQEWKDIFEAHPMTSKTSDTYLVKASVTLVFSFLRHHPI